MKRFKYRAKTKEGKEIKGVVEARDEKQAVAILREKGFFVISLKVVKEGGGVQGLLSIFQKVSFGELVNFTRQFSTMITAGLSLPEALEILRVQASSGMARIIGEVLRDIEGGVSLADAFKKHPRVFPKVYVALVKAGEAAGVLDQVLARLADNLEKQREFRGKTRGALIYPTIIITGMGLVMLIMMLFVLPRMTVMYEEFGAQLPTPTQLLISFSHFLRRFWWLSFLFFFGAAYWFRLLRSTAVGRRKIDGLLLRLPIFGELIKKLLLTEFTRTLGLLVGAGISILDSLGIARETMGNAVYQEGLRRVAQKVEKGFSLAAALAEEEEFPPLLSQMISVGEETGKVDEVLSKVSSYFEGESERAIKGLTTAIEPLILIVLGVGVGFLVISVIMPIYNLTTQF